MARTPIQLYDPDEMAAQLARRIREERLRRKWKQETLAARSGVSLPTVRRYERLGRTSIENVLKLCHALGRLDEFAELLKPLPVSSIAELEARSVERKYKRGTR
ncbi:MAG: helix-turn-helix transcriptional regulator [Algisphaera sp.]